MSNRAALGIWIKTVLLDDQHLSKPIDQVNLEQLALELYEASVLIGEGPHPHKKGAQLLFERAVYIYRAQELSGEDLATLREDVMEVGACYYWLWQDSRRC